MQIQNVIVVVVEGCCCLKERDVTFKNQVILVSERMLYVIINLRQNLMIV